MFVPRNTLKLGHIAVASDGSDVARGAYLAAREIAARAGARIMVMRAIPGHRVPVGAFRNRSEDQWARLEDWVTSVGADRCPSEVDVAFGHPSIEIPRYAETHGADLLVLGRTPRNHAARIRVGDTADAVVRRSVVPCLLVPPGTGAPTRLLAAVDGTPRGRRVLDEAEALARLTGMVSSAVTVEPGTVEGSDPHVRAGTQRLQVELGGRLRVRHGPIYDEVLAEIRDTGADLLAIGVRRGGPAGVLELGSVGRRLAHGAPCAVLTIPL